MDEWLDGQLGRWMKVFLEVNVQIDSLHFSYTNISTKPLKDASSREHSVWGLRDSDSYNFVHSESQGGSLS